MKFSEPVSAWSRWRDIVSTAVVIGGLSYAVYQFLRVSNSVGFIFMCVYPVKM